MGLFALIISYIDLMILDRDSSEETREQKFVDVKTRSQQPIHRPLHLRINIDWRCLFSCGIRKQTVKTQKGPTE